MDMLVLFLKFRVNHAVCTLLSLGECCKTQTDRLHIVFNNASLFCCKNICCHLFNSTKEYSGINYDIHNFSHILFHIS